MVDEHFCSRHDEEHKAGLLWQSVAWEMIKEESIAVRFDKLRREKAGLACYDTVSDHLESLSTSVIEILTAGRLNGQCSGLYG